MAKEGGDRHTAGKVSGGPFEFMDQIREGVIGVKYGGGAGGAEDRSSEGGVKGRGTAGGFEALTDQLHVTI